MKAQFQTEDNYVMSYVLTDKATSLEEVQKKLEAGNEIGLRAVVEPIRLHHNTFHINNLYSIHFYTATELIGRPVLD